MAKAYEKDEHFFRQIERLGGQEAHKMALDFLKEKPVQKEPSQLTQNRGIDL